MSAAKVYKATIILALGNARSELTSTVIVPPGAPFPVGLRDSMKEHIARSNHDDRWLSAAVVHFGVEQTG